jgi:hypothetical protein
VPSIAVAVTSPSKRDSEPTWLVAAAVAAVLEVVEAEALIAPVLTTEPSAGYAKPEPKAAWSGGDEMTPADAPACPGTTTLIATARADAAVFDPAPPAPTVPATRTATPTKATTLDSRFATVLALSAQTAPE